MRLTPLALLVLLAGCASADVGYTLTRPVEAAVPTATETAAARYVVDEADRGVTVVVQNVSRGPLELRAGGRVVPPAASARPVRPRVLAPGETFTLRLPPAGRAGGDQGDLPDLAEIGPYDGERFTDDNRGGVAIRTFDSEPESWRWPVAASVGVELPWTLPTGEERVDRLTLTKVRRDR